MSDRELLELAAKACRIVLADEVDSYIPASRAMWVVGPGGRDAIWNPLNDDGDALRLAVKLNMEVCSHANADIGGISWADVSGAVCAYIELPHDGDPMAATRRAIVRAAAELGRSA